MIKHNKKINGENKKRIKGVCSSIHLWNTQPLFQNTLSATSLTKQ
jgi:hypothetical protein